MVDDLQSPWLRCCCDIANTLIIGAANPVRGAMSEIACFRQSSALPRGEVRAGAMEFARGGFVFPFEESSRRSNKRGLRTKPPASVQ